MNLISFILYLPSSLIASIFIFIKNISSLDGFFKEIAIVSNKLETDNQFKLIFRIFSFVFWIAILKLIL
jgi:cellobiose-specific phosphotransferase system component IIC